MRYDAASDELYKRQFVIKTESLSMIAETLSVSAFPANLSDVTDATKRDKSETLPKDLSGNLFITIQGLESGRLGNHMFKYASLLGIARAMNREPIISPGLKLDAVFNLRHVAEVQETKQ